MIPYTCIICLTCEFNKAPQQSQIAFSCWTIVVYKDFLIDAFIDYDKSNGFQDAAQYPGLLVISVSILITHLRAHNLLLQIAVKFEIYLFLIISNKVDENWIYGLSSS